MKTRIPLLAIGLTSLCSVAMATEYGRVLASTPVTVQVAVPEQQCSEQQALVQPRNSGGGALIGALIGGVVGHNLGHGYGRGASTGLGVLAGSVIGDRVEASNNPPVEVPVRSCRTVSRSENRLLGYDVTYEYQGQRYATRLAQDPGEWLALNVSVRPAAEPLSRQSIDDADAPVVRYEDPYAARRDYRYGTYGPAVIVTPRIGFYIGGGHRHGY